jgi:BirA family biotin operon repressor/biotin-[acetyl-CoA-carboxylase] ligase
LPHPPPGIPFTELQSVDSTNNYALSRIHAGLTLDREGFFAHEQVAGKGQRGRKWSSQPGENIILSIVRNPYPLQLSQQFQLSAAVAVGLHHFYSKYAGPDTKIKWPNDLYWQDRKAAGILIESVVTAQTTSKEPSNPAWKWAVIGIGVNLNQTTFSPDLINPVSLKQVTGKAFNTVEMASELFHTVNESIDLLLSKGFEGIFEIYNSWLYKKGNIVRLKKGNRIFESVIKGVSAMGKLMTFHAIEEEFDFGEIEWLKDPA